MSVRTQLSCVAIVFIFLLACRLSPQPTPPPTATFVPTFTPKPIINPEQSPTFTPKTTQSSDTVGLERVNIYLIAMGDNGASGKFIGCGDSLVPVEIPITPTLGVLRAAINEQLKLQGQDTYGDSGLLNSLHLSDLILDDVAIIEGEAIIEFSGTLIYGGECDIPRIEEQLKALALQFSTVDQVTILVNGIPIEQLLDLRG